MKILIVEDEKDLIDEIESYLLREDYVIETSQNYRNAIDKLAIYVYDLALIDITLPDGTGLDLIKYIKKKRYDIGILIISAKNSLNDKLKGLELWADDYITKPFHLAELNARIKALYRRRRFNGANKITHNEIVIYLENKEVTVCNKPIQLTKKEYELLCFFVANKNRLITKESIAEHLWGDDIDLANNFDFIYTHILNLRKKISSAGGEDYLKTVYGMGYKFV